MNPLSDTVDFVLPPASPAVKRSRLLSAPVCVDIAGLSHQGYVRRNNEDHFFVARFGRFLERLCTNLPEDEMPARAEETGYGLVVADGIGGSAAGEVASRLAITTLVNLVLGTPDWIMRTDDEARSQEVRRRVLERYRKIGSVLEEQAEVDPALSGLGTTMTVAMGVGKELLVANVGDSRAYLLRQQVLFQLTRDHTLAQGLAERGVISQQQVASHPFRHVLTRALGGEGGPAEPDVQEIVLEDGDSLLLCTDGLTEMVSEDRIAEVLSGGKAAEKVCRRLVEEALEAGGKDNVTVVVARYEFPGAE